MAARRSNFVLGEASESEEEYEIDQSYFMKNTMVVKQDNTTPKQSIVVEGEASESDEEPDESMPNDEVIGAESELRQDLIVQENVQRGKANLSDEQTKRKVKFHYDS